ncbi:hypothetical protein PC116_g6905 [Phytophthora cactorum]|uniref:Uncharacterized protein n=1 Tax=Phytophthora cactorum TaxID=29920 RepID=A0A8T1EIY2_9STRA|nr:hypothetical protein PC114_g4531 [Phytophthora cactorum]KAG2954967.1 hypothetical protein PC117_g822 [Phytophthora cactorum]KAG3040351.1 hypothetical protein PC119_g1511 [Phytophthora cactorum]KAG3186540.1 hypothetical protein C6341_g3775 [Phytophthora cactorum]KAG3199745.1 hypothetical protein PC128_g5118 [Phytophthora cactorum]
MRPHADQTTTLARSGVILPLVTTRTTMKVQCALRKVEVAAASPLREVNAAAYEYDTAYSEMIKYLKAPSDSVCVVHTKPFSC